MTKGNQSKVPLNVAIAGFGTVGQSVARILCEGSHDSLRLSQICNRDVERKHVNWVPPDVFWTDQIDDVLTSNADVLVELIGGLDPATDWIRRALKAGKSVVTANKQVIAHYGPTLLDLAQQHHCRLCFEAAVAGGIPVIRTLQEGLAGDSLFRIMGILNGTCNYILTRMEANKIPFTSALGEAQQLGYAEADPTADVEGLDSQAKLAILAAVSLRCQVDVDTIPLRTITARRPNRLRLCETARLHNTSSCARRTRYVDLQPNPGICAAGTCTALLDAGSRRRQPKRSRRRGKIWRGNGLFWLRGRW